MVRIGLDRLENREERSEAIAIQLDEIGQKILGAARDELYIGMRFLDVALSSFFYEMDGAVHPFGTDGMKIYFHPKELGGLYKENRILVNRGYLHMVYHCLFRHMLKIVPNKVKQSTVGQTMEEGSMKNTDQAAKEITERYWDLSCDIAVECLIDSNDHRSIRFSRSLLRRETYRRLQSELEHKALNAERIYECILSWQMEEKELIRLEKEFYVDDHQYWDNKMPDKKPPNPDLNRKWQEIDEQMETDMETFSKEASEKMGDLVGQLSIENREKQNYRQFLEKFSIIREEMGVDPDTFDYTFYSYGLSLYGNMPLIEPLETKEVKKVRDFVIVIDTSMSCSGEKVKQFLETTYDVLSSKESFFEKVNIHIIQCDEKVHSDVKVTDEESLKNYMESLALYGEGGTDFRPAFEYVNELVDNNEFEDLRGLIYFTDGYGVFPKKMPVYQTAFVLPEEDDGEVEIPAWAIRIVMEDDLWI